MSGAPTRGTNRGSERKSVSHPASGCLRGIEETQEGRDPQGTDPHRRRPTQRGAPHYEGATHTRGATHTGDTQTVPAFAPHACARTTSGLRIRNATTQLWNSRRLAPTTIARLLA